MFGVHEICHKFFIVWHCVTPLSSQVKVREATSNDPWGPSSTQMSEIADLTYNMVSLPLFIVLASSNLYQVAFSEIMQMIWKRLNDHGKNWRHVYKALVLLEYLIKTGSEKVKIFHRSTCTQFVANLSALNSLQVAQQCKENIFAIQTLKDFQFVEENKDQGLNVREKAKAMVSLLKVTIFKTINLNPIIELTFL